MGCCGGRPIRKGDNNNQSTDSTSKEENPDMGLKGPPNLRKSSNSHYKSHNSLQNYSSKNLMSKTEELLLMKRKLLEADEDTRNLQKAKEQNDLGTIVDYLKNDKKMTTDIEIQPPWAEHPRSVGSLALVYVGLIYASISVQDPGKIESERKRVNEILIKKKAENVFIQNLKAHDLDRNELTVLLLIIILEENPKLQELFYANGVFHVLVDYLGPLNPATKKPNKRDLRLGALQAVREFLRDRPKKCVEFCNERNLEYIQGMLEDPEDNVIFEGLIFIDELTTENTTLNSRNMSLMTRLMEMGFVTKLKKVIEIMSKPLPEEKQEDPEAVEMRENSKKYAKFLIENLTAFNSLN